MVKRFKNLRAAPEVRDDKRIKVQTEVSIIGMGSRRSRKRNELIVHAVVVDLGSVLLECEVEWRVE